MEASVRLNLFQRMMLRWRDLHPYNPVHVVHVPAALEAERLRACIAGQLTDHGLTGLTVDQRRWRYRYEGGPAAVTFEVISAGTDALAELSRTIEREFNRPFAKGRQENPFRFLAIDAGDTFRLVLVYDHYVAGGDAVARLLSAMACAYIGAGGLRVTIAHRAPTYRHLFLRHPLWVVRSLLGLARTVTAVRRAYRVRYDRSEDGHNAFAYLRLGPQWRTALLGAAKAWGVTRNEILMAGLMIALSPLAAQRRRETRRRELSAASILNIRVDFGPDARDALDPLLAAYRVAHELPEGIGLRSLALALHGEVVRVRIGHLYLQSIMTLGLSALLWPWLSTSGRHGLYAKHFPAWAGITSLNMNPIWTEMGGECTAGLDYLRAVPTGPLCPLVFAVTSAHDVLHIGIAYRTAALSRAEVDRVAADFMRCIGELPGAPSA